ncbi:DUF3575 domain-containing protein [Polaribacter sp. HL-MS24]|uniref:DUF3575 domain-containing protein n=1 Tax=Polaribacter sp. HL-MS24 TaxID=3077735 RepID=UPI0029344AEB|nr:DUF3575 domain-containing protein [Polaribacter sp. HL-MS24]WOC39507.1 DUF3575 domain-containing protein [Polaribacter sp. HL-MS24]
MKKILSILTFLVATHAAAQQEVKLNIGNALVIKTIDISYEYYLSGDSSVGISGLYNFEKKSSDFRYNEESMFTPYFRHYFTADKTWNLFGEAFFGYSTGYTKIKSIDETGTIYEKYSDGALGIAVGSKYTSEGGLVVDIFGGIGRNLFSANSPIIVPRLGVNLGWRF